VQPSKATPSAPRRSAAARCCCCGRRPGWPPGAGSGTGPRAPPPAGATSPPTASHLHERPPLVTTLILLPIGYAYSQCFETAPVAKCGPYSSLADEPLTGSPPPTDGIHHPGMRPWSGRHATLTRMLSRLCRAQALVARCAVCKRHGPGAVCGCSRPRPPHRHLWRPAGPAAAAAVPLPSLQAAWI
jgi:hypothetical protein